MGCGLFGNPPLHINILCCMLLMCLQVVNKRSLSLLGPKVGLVWLDMGSPCAEGNRMSNHGFGPSTVVVCALISLYHRKSWFSGASFIGYGQQYRGYDQFSLTDRKLQGPLPLRHRHFDGYCRLSRKRCEIGRWLLWNVNRKSWVPDRLV